MSDSLAKNLILDMMEKKYDLMNVFTEDHVYTKKGVEYENHAKTPRKGKFAFKGWEKASRKELLAAINYDADGFGLRLGLQENNCLIMSLDFDICGEKDEVTGKRKGCDETAALWKEFKANVNRDDGIFSSSTAGNWNVLIDYTSQADIVALVVRMNKAKFKHFGLEVLMKQNQVIPPTATTCKVTGKLGKPRKFLNDVPFYIMTPEDVFVHDFILNLLKTQEEKIKPTTKSVLKDIPASSLSSVNDSNEDRVSNEQIRDLLMNVFGPEKLKSFNDWFEICGVLKGNGYPIELWIDYNNQLSESNSKRNASKKWEQPGTGKSVVHVKHLFSLASKLRPEAFSEFCKRHATSSGLQQFKLQDWYTPKEVSEVEKKEDVVVVTDEYDAINKVYASLRDRIVYSRHILYFKTDNLWISDETAIKAALNVYVSEFKLVKTICTKTGNEYVPFTFKRQIAVSIAYGVIDLAVKNKDDAWHDKVFSSSLGKILFTNGYWDFNLGQFFPNSHELFDKSIVFVEHIPFDYEFSDLTKFDEQDFDYMRSIKDRLFYQPFGKEVGDWYLLKLARALAGDCQKNVLVGIGAGNNGKSLLTSACKAAFGGYFGAYNGNCLKYKQIATSDEAQSLRWVMLLQHKRAIFSSEMPLGTPIDGNLLRKLSNGGLDPIVARGHGGNEVEFKVAFLPILLANDINDIKPMDEAVSARVKCINYVKECVDNPTDERYHIKKDNNLIYEIETMRFKQMFLSNLFFAYEGFNNPMGILNEGKRRVEVEPEGVKHAFKEILGESGESIVSKFLKDFEITGDESNPYASEYDKDRRYFVASKDVEEWLKNSQITIAKFSRDFNKHIVMNNIQGVSLKDKKIGGKTKKVWFGIRQLLDEDEKISEME